MASNLHPWESGHVPSFSCREKMQYNLGCRFVFSSYLALALLANNDISTGSTEIKHFIQIYIYNLYDCSQYAVMWVG